MATLSLTRSKGSSLEKPSSPLGVGLACLEGSREQKCRRDVDRGVGCLAPLEVACFKKEAKRVPISFLCLLPTSRPLSLAVGVKLLEILAEHVHMSSGSFINIRWDCYPGWGGRDLEGGLSGEVAGGVPGRGGRVQGGVRDAPSCIQGTAAPSPAAGPIQYLLDKHPCRASLIGSSPIL